MGELAHRLNPEIQPPLWTPLI
ncbi:hypothetical protein BCEP4_510041 [Burkholderia cepacia]|nr:hypothetical protein BCEP4_510041 [Burkholderia cepacia]